MHMLCSWCHLLFMHIIPNSYSTEMHITYIEYSPFPFKSDFQRIIATPFCTGVEAQPIISKRKSSVRAVTKMAIKMRRERRKKEPEARKRKRAFPSPILSGWQMTSSKTRRVKSGQTRTFIGVIERDWWSSLRWWFAACQGRFVFVEWRMVFNCSIVDYVVGNTNLIADDVRAGVPKMRLASAIAPSELHFGVRKS